MGVQSNMETSFEDDRFMNRFSSLKVEMGTNSENTITQSTFEPQADNCIGARWHSTSVWNFTSFDHLNDFLSHHGKGSVVHNFSPIAACPGV